MRRPLVVGAFICAQNQTWTSRNQKSHKAKGKSKAFTVDEVDEAKAEYTDTRLLTLYNTMCYPIFCQK